MMKTAIHAPAPKALFRAVSSTITAALTTAMASTMIIAGTTLLLTGSLMPAAEAKHINETTITTDDLSVPLTVYVHEMYDVFDRPVLTYFSLGTTDTLCGYSQGFQGAPEDGFYAELFYQACAEHNYAYHHAPWRKAGFSSEAGKAIADDRFMVDMLYICEDVFGASAELDGVADCERAAATYSETVRNSPLIRWEITQDRLTNDPNTQVIHTLPVDERTAQMRANLDGLRQSLLDRDPL